MYGQTKLKHSNYSIRMDCIDKSQTYKRKFRDTDTVSLFRIPENKRVRPLGLSFNKCALPIIKW